MQSHEPNSGSYVITLCRLPGPGPIRPPSDPELAAFTFYTSRLCHPDGIERLYLNLGYFEKLADAQKWLERLRPRYPNAVATRAPAPAPAVDQADADAPAESLPSPAAGTISDTQMMEVLEMGRMAPGEASADVNGGSQVKLIRPEDTDTRRILKEAVVAGAPVSFAVQLHWSTQPINPGSVQRLEIFRSYMLYSTESRREGRSCFFLRLGFFKDAISAKQVAVYVRSKFASAAVVPVTEAELAHAHERPLDSAPASDTFQQRIDQALDADRRHQNANGHSAAKSTGASSRSVVKPAQAPSQTKELLAAGEMWGNDDSLNDTGVRHLKISVEKRPSKRS